MVTFHSQIYFWGLSFVLDRAIGHELVLLV